MSVTVTLAGVDRTSQIDQHGLQVQQIIGAQRDTASLIYKKYGSKSYTPAVFDAVLISDGPTKAFGGRIATITQLSINDADGVTFELECVDYSIDLDSELVSQEYDVVSVQEIIHDFVTNFATGFTDNHVSCTYVVQRIVFNQVPISQAIKKLADLMQYDWYVDPDKDIHFFPKYAELAPFGLTDSSGNYVGRSLQTETDGTQMANQVKVRGGTYEAPSFSDTITVKGDLTKSWVLPYKFDAATLAIAVNGTPQTVGIYGQDDFPAKNVLYRDADQSIQVENPLLDGDEIDYSGNPLIPVLAVASDSASIALYGVREKIIEDSSIADLNVARQRSIAEVNAYKDPLQKAKFTTYDAGLRTGQVINIASARRGIDTNYIIRQVTFGVRTPTSFAYSVEAVTVRTFTLIEVLQALLQPDNLPIDPNEVSEVIKADLATVSINETVALRASPDHVDVATATLSETIARDPLGPGVAPAWVLGPYMPGSLLDPKRVINLDRASAVLY